MLEGLLQLVRSEPWLVAAEITAIWLVVWLAYRFLRGTRGGGAIRGFAVLLVIGTFLIRVIGQGSELFERLSFLYGRFLGLAAIMLIVVFQPELRQAMIRLGHAWSFNRRRGEARTTATTIGEACEYLSRAKFGAIIAIERQTRLGGLAESGVELDALISPRLLQSIFYPNAPLHDLGVVIRGDRIAAASVQFPLAEEGVLPPDYGARHRAAVGLSTECDALVVVVSEETGSISIAERGAIEGPFDRTTLVAELVRRLEGAGTEDQQADDETADEESADGDATNDSDASEPGATTASAEAEDDGEVAVAGNASGSPATSTATSAASRRLVPPADAGTSSRPGSGAA